MVESEKSEELIDPDKLIKENKYSQALEVLIELEKKQNLPLNQKVYCLTLQGRLLIWLGKHEDSIMILKKAYEESLGLGKNLQTIDPLLLIALVHNWQGRFDKASEIIKNSEDLLNTFSKDGSTEYISREASLNFIKGYLVSQKDTEKGLKFLKYSLSLWNKLETGIEKAMTIMCIGLTLYLSKGDLDQSIDYLKQGLAIAEELNHKFGKAFLQRNLGSSYYLKGEINHSLEFIQKSLKNYKEINNKPQIASLYSVIAERLKEKGEFEKALKYIKKSMALNEEIGVFHSNFSPIGTAFEISLEMDDREQAQTYLGKLKQINEMFKPPNSDVWVIFYEALLLKKKARIRDKAQAEVLLKQALEKSSNFSLTIDILVHLCDLFLTEFQTTNNLEVLEEINSIINKLLDNAEKSHSYWILCETYILQAKLALLTLKIEEAQQFLTKAQKLAEKFGITRLAMKISNEHDELLNQLNKWENLKESNAPLTERVELARLSDQMENILRKRTIDLPEYKNEEPVFLLIVSEGGTPIFSQSFLEGQSFEDHLFGGFFTTINSFINEKFSKGLDRAVFGEYTLIMNSVSPFFIFYVFKGQSYSAQKSINYFVTKIQNNESLWQTFRTFYQMGKEIKLKDNHSFELLIKQIFIDQTVQLEGLF